MQADEYLFEGLAVTGGTPTGFLLPVPHRGIIYRLIVAQTSGTLGGFSYTLFNDPQACDIGPLPVATGRDQLFAIAGPCTVAAGDAYHAPSEPSLTLRGMQGLYLPYMTRDFTGVRGSQDYGLRLRIDVVGAGDKTFAAALTLSQGEYA